MLRLVPPLVTPHAMQHKIGERSFLHQCNHFERYQGFEPQHSVLLSSELGLRCSSSERYYASSKTGQTQKEKGRERSALGGGGGGAGGGMHSIATCRSSSATGGLSIPAAATACATAAASCGCRCGRSGESTAASSCPLGPGGPHRSVCRSPPTLSCDQQATKACTFYSAIRIGHQLAN